MKKIKKIISFNKLLLTTFISLFFINGIIYIFDKKLGLFNAVHSIVLRNISSALEASPSRYINETDSVVILISNEMFEKYSNYQTPFNKKIMTQILDKIYKQEPKAFIVDFDISPYYDFEVTKNDYLVNPLYTKLKDIAKTTPVIIPFLFMGETTENQMLKLFWIRDMCSYNIHFATPLVSSEVGVVLQYNNYKKQLNLLANNVVKKEDIHSLCTNIENLANLDLNLIKNYILREYNQSEKLPINYQAINSSTIKINHVEDLDNFNLKDKVIYLGAGYGFTDLFATPYGEKYGVEIHNAIYYSLDNKIAPANIVISIFADIAIGVLFGIILSWTLVKRKIIKTTNMLILNNLAIVGIVLFFIMLSTYVSAILFHSIFIWLNPIPIILGMFIDMMIGIDNKKFDDSIKTNWIKVTGKTLLIFVGILSVFHVI